MSTTELSTPEALLHAVEKLNSADLDRFVDRVLLLRAQRKSPHRSRRETQLLKKINEGLPEGVRERYRALQEKRKAETITLEEHEELKALIDRVEIQNARRIGYLIELAQMRHKSLDEVMDELGIKSPGYE